MKSAWVLRLRATVLCLVCGVGWGMTPMACAQADDLGRLFFTPPQRLAIERSRTETPDLPNAKGVSAQHTPGLVSIEGLVTRSNGAPSIWVNGRLIERDKERATGTLTVEGRTVRVDGGTRLKVGQAVNSAAPSTVIDLVEPGRVTQGGAPTKRMVDPEPGLRLQPSTSRGSPP